MDIHIFLNGKMIKKLSQIQNLKKKMIAGLNLQTTIVPRDAFFGGRTEVFHFFAEAEKNTAIKY